MVTTAAEDVVGAEPIENARTPPTRLARTRGVAFTVVVLVTLAAAVVMMRAELALAATGWTTDLGIHQVHDVTVFSMLWIVFLAPLALSLYRPRSRVNAILAPLVFLVPLGVFAVAEGSPIVMLPVLFGTLSLVAFALHPAGRDLFRFDRVEPVHRGLVALLLLAALPLLAYAGDQFVRQLTAADEHAIFVHYAAMAVASVYVLLMGTLAVVRRRDWRVAAYSAGLVAVVLGVASIRFGVESSVGPTWGALAVAFGVGFPLAVEYVRRRKPDRRETPESSPTDAA